LSGARGLRFLIGWVAVVATLLLAASRWAGRLASPGRLRGGPDAVAGREARVGPPAEASIPSLPQSDLTFYQALGGPRAAPGVRNVPDDGGAPGGAIEDGAVPGGAYVVQAVATRDGVVARRLCDRLRARGLPAVLSEERVSNTVVYRVRVGRYRDRSVAEIVARRIRARDGLNPWVLREAG